MFNTGTDVLSVSLSKWLISHGRYATRVLGQILHKQMYFVVIIILFC